MKNAREKYKGRMKICKGLLEKQDKAINLISNLRLFVTVIGITCFIFLYRADNYYAALGTSAAFCLIFLYLVIIHNKAIKFREYIAALYKVNDISAKRFSDEWKLFDDTGVDFKDDGHPFSQDLDIFGKASLFQWISTANTNSGRLILKKMLSEPCYKADEIKMRQDAVNELSKMLWWRQRFSLEGTMVSNKADDEVDLFKWANERNKLYNKYLVITGVSIMPVITVVALILSYIFHLIPEFVFILLAVGQFGMLYLFGDERNKALSTAFKYKKNIKLYAKMLKQFEKSSFKSAHLKELKSLLLNSNNQTASMQIEKLEKIVDNISNRKNPMFLPVNVLLLWDYQCMISLERWKEKSGHLVEKWINAVGEMEALSSLAVIKHDYPDWVVPDFTKEHSVLIAKSIGHPLIINKQVCNDVMIKAPTKALLITGSNMSGKSTLLRTVGINLVLAYAGAPVCAGYLRCSIMSIHTCMRVSDNLEKNISSFYAELMRIKDIVNSTNNEKQVFFLLDEIFKGTNSNDRHIGAKLLIKKLYNNGAVGLISTHDLQLGEMENESNGQIKNYHFQEYYKENQIYFDYKLRPGISTTTNALYLIKMAGIDAD